MECTLFCFNYGEGGNKMSLKIKALTPDDGEDIYNMLLKIPADENGFMNPVCGKTYSEYKEWLVKAYNNSLQKEIIDGWKVPETIFWLYEDNAPVGFGKIRHFLTDKLLESGGNIGYSISPDERERGLGTQFIKGLLEEAKKIGVDNLLFTIKNYNTPSIKAALANGGIIQKVTDERHYINIML